jgi:uncharacterized protein (UPF0262 family)
VTDAIGGDARPPAARIVLVDAGLDRLSPPLADNVRQAIADLRQDNSFEPVGLQGPFTVHVSVQQGRLVFDIRDDTDQSLRLVGLALGPFRRLIKDYMLLVESHETASRHGGAQRIEAIDMGRRGLHNEGAAQMVERLRGKIAIDFETARRLFTLACALQQR